MNREPLEHVVFIAGTCMTHVRPALHFVARLLAKFSNLFVSFYVNQAFVPQASKYLDMYHRVVSQRILLAISPVEVQPEQFFKAVLSFESYFGPWIAEQLSRYNTEINGCVVKAPSYIIEDHVNGGVALTNSGYHNLPVASWWAPNAVSFLSLLGKNECGSGSRYYDSILTALDQQPDVSLEDILSERPPNELVLTPGLPPYYEHEQVTQDDRELLLVTLQMRRRWNRMLEDMHTAIFVSVHEMESVAIEACANAFPRPLTTYSPGLAVDLPQSKPPGCIDSSHSDPALKFMNRAYTELGAHSVVYIGFGTIYFPTPESAGYLKILIDELVAHGLRVIFSVNPKYAEVAKMDEEYTEKLTRAGLAMFPSWVPQLEVLEHPALHYFVSHAGWNSICEAIVRGVPMIFWPMGGDQPINAIHMTRHHDCGFELLQVRTGMAKNNVFSDRGDIPVVGSAEAVREEIRRILALSKGERGVQQRRNATELGKVAVKAIEAGGSGDIALEKLGKQLGL